MWLWRRLRDESGFPPTDHHRHAKILAAVLACRVGTVEGYARRLSPEEQRRRRDVTQNEGAASGGHGPRSTSEQSGRRLSRSENTATQRLQQARRAALRSAINRIRRRYGAGAVRIAADLLAEVDG